MDIRVSAYNPTSSNVTRSASAQGNPLATAYVQGAAPSSPVAAAEPVRAIQNAPRNAVAAGPDDGYTDSVRGSLINILA